MKKLLFLMFIGLSSMALKAQQPVTEPKANKPPSDVSLGYTYDYDKVFDLLYKEAAGITKSDKSIEQYLMNTPDFPKVSEHLNNEAFLKASIKQWIETHPNAILEAYKQNQEIVKPFGY